MIIYEGLKNEFLVNVLNDKMAKIIESNILNKMNRKTSRNEFKAFVNSLEFMYKVMNDKEIPDSCGIAIEYNIPLTSKRVDFIISGFNETKSGHAIIIELKQWDKVSIVEGSNAIVETYTGNALRKVVHPSYQAWSYASLISDYNYNVQNNNITLEPCVYMHNYIKKENDPIENKIYEYYINLAPIFSNGEVIKLRNFIKKYIKFGDNKQILYQIEGGKIKPSKSLQDSLVKMLTGNQEFIMIDNQKVIMDSIVELSNQSKIDNKKRVFIVEGGPGTGKSVIAINLLVKLTENSQLCQYISKNSAPREVYSAKLKGTLTKTNIDNLFKGSGCYIETPSNFFDTLIVDEAHRLNEKGVYSKSGENQIKEIINASKFSIFFIDENQQIHINDIGDIDEIKKWANYYDAELYTSELDSQFRCNGSDGFLSFIDNALQIKETANYDLEGINYDFRVVDDPITLKNMIFDKNKKNNKSRILAGYCWNWNKDNKNNSNYHDIVIGDFSMSWNLENTIYAIHDTSVNEVGCIHTSQGLEFEYVGVIIGPDLKYENGELVTDFNERAFTDKSLNGIKTMYKKDKNKALTIANKIIKNTYRTLLTRGMKGCYIYCCDRELQEYFKKFIK